MPTKTAPPLWLLVLSAAMAGGMGWGIRGQYGHQTGAMIAGLMVGLVLVLLLVPQWSSRAGARVVAFMALGISLGGSMTYGQTLGLTQDEPLIGNWDALRWGLLGVFLKGGIWIGLAGLFLGLALSQPRYRPTELALMVMAAVFVRFLGIQWLNQPYQPEDRLLPQWYFSDAWIWEPGAELRPRRELWGGLLLAFVALTAYARAVRKDRLVLRLAVCGFLAGGVGFASGQSLQAFHAWNREAFQTGWLSTYDSTINWWNMMEITFGAVSAGILSAGVWLNRNLIPVSTPPTRTELTTVPELLLLIVHVSVLIAWSFGDSRELEFFADMAFTMVLIPAVAIYAGRDWPFWFILPIILIPIAGKTLRQLSYRTELISQGTGWLVLVVIPILVSGALAIAFAHSAREGKTRGSTTGVFAGGTLLFVVWLYFALNFAFFEFPWPWQDWTMRTPSAIIFTVCSIGLTVIVLLTGRLANHSAESQNAGKKQSDESGRNVNGSRGK